MIIDRERWKTMAENVRMYQDTTCKMVLGGQSKLSKAALKGFLEALLSRPIREITVSVQEVIDASYLKQKLTRYDIHITFNDGERAILEMQAEKPVYDLGTHFAGYIHKAHSVSLEAGDRLEEKRFRLILISLLHFDLDQADNFVTHLELDMADDEYAREWNPDLEKNLAGLRDTSIYAVELKKVRKKDPQAMTPLERWIYTFNHIHEFEEIDYIEELAGITPGMEEMLMLVNGFTDDQMESLRKYLQAEMAANNPYRRVDELAKQRDQAAKQRDQAAKQRDQALEQLGKKDDEILDMKKKFKNLLLQRMEKGMTLKQASQDLGMTEQEAKSYLKEQ